MSIQAIPVETGASTTARAAAAPRKRRDEGRAGIGLAAPFLILYVLFLIGATLYSVVLSCFNSSLEHAGLGGFTGADNYTQALTSSDFWQSMWHTVLFTLMTTPPLVVIALVLAIFTDRLPRGRWVFPLILFPPV